jgi:signal transduction histidine kinase
VLKAMHSEMDGREVAVVCGDHLPSVMLDPRLVKLALKQLVGNSLKYSPPGRPVKIVVSENHSSAAGVSEGGPWLTLDVTDQGGGIPMSEQSKIFERFYRSPSVRQRIPGSGLGLSIAYRIARAHNGDLTVISHPGETTFRLTLPVPGGESS